jgi:effector-binding domain-containing protein
MKNRSGGLGLILILAAVAAAQEPSAVVKAGEPFWYVYQEFRGPVDQIPDRIGGFIQEVLGQGLREKIGGDLFGIFFNHPLLVGDKKDFWALGFRVSKEIPAKPPLKIARYDYPRIATTVYRGPFEMASNAYNQVLVPLLDEKRLEVIGPPIEIWIGNPELDKPEDLKTEILLPVAEIKKKI